MTKSRQITGLVLGLLIASSPVARSMAEPLRSSSRFEDLLEAELGDRAWPALERRARRLPPKRTFWQARAAKQAAALNAVQCAEHAYLSVATSTEDAPSARGECAIEVPLPASDALARLAATESTEVAGESVGQTRALASRAHASATARLAQLAWVEARLGALVAEQALVQARAQLDQARAAAESGVGSDDAAERAERQLLRAEALVTAFQNLRDLGGGPARVAVNHGLWPRRAGQAEQAQLGATRLDAERRLTRARLQSLATRSEARVSELRRELGIH